VSFQGACNTFCQGDVGQVGKRTRGVPRGTRVGTLRQGFRGNGRKCSGKKSGKKGPRPRARLLTLSRSSRKKHGSARRDESRKGVGNEGFKGRVVSLSVATRKGRGEVGNRAFGTMIEAKGRNL